MANYKVSPEAENDLYLIWLYGLEHWGLNAADSYISDLFVRFQRIADNPRQFSDVEDIRTGYRRVH
jgi:toxin ParE1/3/4